MNTGESLDETEARIEAEARTRVHRLNNLTARFSKISDKWQVKAPDGRILEEFKKFGGASGFMERTLDFAAGAKKPVSGNEKGGKAASRSGGRKFEECGSCGMYHPAGFSGDCRDDKNRFNTDEILARFPDAEIVELMDGSLEMFPDTKPGPGR